MTWSFAQLYIDVEDKGDHLLVTYGPNRWLLCGMGKEKIRYDHIHKYTVTRSCMFGAGIDKCSGIKLFNTCSCCCDNSRCWNQQTLRITIDERMQALDAIDIANDCCLEQCFFNNCCGTHAEYIGKGCCFSETCNPCNVNCCAVNTIYLSTNDMNGLLLLLDEKCCGGSTNVGENDQGGGFDTINIPPPVNPIII